MKPSEAVQLLFWISYLRRDRAHYVRQAYTFRRQGCTMAASRCMTVVRGCNDRMARARHSLQLLTWGAAA